MVNTIKNSTYSIVVGILLCGIVASSYLLGYQRGQSGGTNNAVTIDYHTIPKEFVVSASSLSQAPKPNTQGEFFGSKSGTKYYGSNTCANAKRIKPENYVWFSSKEDAEIQGYTRGQC